MDIRLPTAAARAWIARLFAILLLAAAGIASASTQDLAPGAYTWTPEASTQGPVVIVVSLPQQRAHVYRGGVRIGVSTISSGRPGNDTPTGVFPILGKERMHRSNLYDSAPMPYMQRLTWDGVALHAGRIPGYPASHGCVRLPKAFAEKLFDVTESGTLVVVADDASFDASVVWPGDAAPVDAMTGLALLDAAPASDIATDIATDVEPVDLTATSTTAGAAL